MPAVVLHQRIRRIDSACRKHHYSQIVKAAGPLTDHAIEADHRSKNSAPSQNTTPLPDKAAPLPSKAGMELSVANEPLGPDRPMHRSSEVRNWQKIREIRLFFGEDAGIPCLVPTNFVMICNLAVQLVCTSAHAYAHTQALLTSSAVALIIMDARINFGGLVYLPATDLSSSECMQVVSLATIIANASKSTEHRIPGLITAADKEKEDSRRW